jgi:hypothetical protein
MLSMSESVRIVANASGAVVRIAERKRTAKRVDTVTIRTDRMAKHSR